MSKDNQTTMTPVALKSDVHFINCANEAEASLKEFHFFASSVADWIVTTDTRTLPDLIEFMDKTGYPYSVWMVPVNWNTNYEIKWYAPQVEGAKFLGHFKAPKERRKEARLLEKNRAKLKILEVA